MAVDLEQPGKLLEQILTLDLTTCDIAVCIASGDPETRAYQFRYIEYTEKLAQQFRVAVAEALKKYRQKLEHGDLELRDFAAETTKPDQEVEYLDFFPYDSIKNQIKPVETYLDMQRFRHQEREFIDKMRFYVIRIEQKGHKPIYFYQHYTPKQMLSRSPLFAMWLKNNEYDDLDEPTFLFERHIDCFSCEEHMFILNKHYFFRIFNISELEKVAREILNKLEKKDIIRNFQMFKKHCLDDKIKILKLKNIAAKSYLNTLTIDDLHKTIRRYTLPIQVTIDPTGKKRLDYDPKDRWAILHLLDDAYGDSPMTKTSYYIKGKREISQRK